MERLQHELDEDRVKLVQQEEIIEGFHSNDASVKSSLAQVNIQFAALKEDEAAIIAFLCSALVSKGASPLMQDFANQVIAQCTSAESGTISLTRGSGGGKPLRYQQEKRQRVMKTNALPESRKRWLRLKAEELMDIAESRGDEGPLEILKIIARRSNIFVAKCSDVQLSIPQSIALRDHVITGTNGLYRLKQALDAFAPALKGILIRPNIRQHVSRMECNGVVPSNCVEVNCTITKKGNRRGMCTFYYSTKPTQLLSYMLRRMFLDNTVQDAFEFCSSKDVLVISIGFDKSDSDFVGTWRPCNRLNGNSSLFVQTFACLEGPVAENYGNEWITIGNPTYPVKDTVQSLVDDSLYSLVLSASIDGKMKQCECFVFKPVPQLPPGSMRHLDIILSQIDVQEGFAFATDPDELQEGAAEDVCDDELGHPPELPIPLSQSTIRICLVTSDNDDSVIIGFQVLNSDEKVLATKRFYDKLKLVSATRSDIKMKCYQVSGHLSNDNKQINILTGQASCSVSYPMPCCMVKKEDLGRPPEWLQIRFLRAAVSSPREVPDHLIKLIGEFAGMPVTLDPPMRAGEYCLRKTSALWQKRTANGRLKLNADDYSKANRDTGSSFNPPIFVFPCTKQNCGIMHSPAGHITHFWIAVSNAIRERMKGCEWQVRVTSVDAEVKDKIREIKEAIKTSDALAASNEIKKKIRVLRKKIKECDKKADNEMDKGTSDQFREHADNYRVQEESAKEEFRFQAESTELGEYNLILAGLCEFEGVLKAKNALDGKRPKSALEYALWKSIESRAGGKFDTKNSGIEQTNGKGMVSLQYCVKVTHALLGMYPEGHEDRTWLEEKIPGWEALGKAIYEIGCFLKSQKKRSPVICDNKLFVLWCRWEDAFPGKKFNKFHAMFCTIRNFVHCYEMAGRISEESNEAFNGTLAEVKARLRCMPTTEKRVEVTNARTQSNLKGDILEEKLVLQSSIVGKKRGPQKARVRASDEVMVVTSVGGYLEFKGESYFVLTNGNLLPKIWEDIYQWFAGGLAPKEWKESLAKTAPLRFTEKDRAKEGLTQW